MQLLLVNSLLLAFATSTATIVSTDSVAKADPRHAKRVDTIKGIIKARLTHMLDKQAEDTTEAAFCKKEIKSVKQTLEKAKEQVREKLEVVVKAKAADQKARSENNTLTPTQTAERNIVLKKSLPESVKFAKDMAIREDWPTSPAYGRKSYDLVQQRSAPPKPLLRLRKDLDEVKAFAARSEASRYRIQANARHEGLAMSGEDSLEDRAREAADIDTDGDSDVEKHTPLISDPNYKEKKKPATETEKALKEAKYLLKKEMATLANKEKERELIHERCTVPSAHRTSEERFDARQNEIEGLNTALDKFNEWKPASR